MVQINSKDHFPSSVFAETSESVKETTKVDENCLFESGNLRRTPAWLRA
jgi:hypothetical protein